MSSWIKKGGKEQKEFEVRGLEGLEGGRGGCLGKRARRGWKKEKVHFLTTFKSLVHVYIFFAREGGEEGRKGSHRATGFISYRQCKSRCICAHVGVLFVKHKDSVKLEKLMSKMINGIDDLIVKLLANTGNGTLNIQTKNVQVHDLIGQSKWG